MSRDPGDRRNDKKLVMFVRGRSPGNVTDRHMIFQKGGGKKEVGSTRCADLERVEKVQKQLYSEGVTPDEKF